jgi:hypothetical protein
MTNGRGDATSEQALHSRHPLTLPTSLSGTADAGQRGQKGPGERTIADQTAAMHSSTIPAHGSRHKDPESHPLVMMLAGRPRSETRDGHDRRGATLARLRGRQAPWQTGPAAGDESADARSHGRLRGLLTQASATGVESRTSWPCGRNAQPTPGCHRRRDLRHEARGGGHWFWF